MPTQTKAHQDGALNGLESSPVAATIARVASRLFAERGFDATSIREIAEAAAVAKPTVYYHFGSKQGLGEAILTRPIANLAEELTRLLTSDPGQRDPVQLLVSIFQIHLDFAAADPDRSRFVLAVTFGPVSSRFRNEVERFGVAFHQSLLDVAAQLAAAGRIDIDRVEACAQVCRGLVMSSTLDHIFKGKAIPNGLAGRLVSDLLNGFARPAGSSLKQKGST